ncbi:hypothetical protein HK100_004655 [Physocladia obscura]|uniref:Uncharacterized protein n=1 Tax=Physocladia obscura TaxID=109957 RepID=A0AAD5XCV5_9FUNG|nr:hypothetical protein HK100_004655 [Physocladia obscura]
MKSNQKSEDFISWNSVCKTNKHESGLMLIGGYCCCCGSVCGIGAGQNNDDDDDDDDDDGERRHNGGGNDGRNGNGNGNGNNGKRAGVGALHGGGCGAGGAGCGVLVVGVGGAVGVGADGRGSRRLPVRVDGVVARAGGLRQRHGRGGIGRGVDGRLQRFAGDHRGGLRVSRASCFVLRAPRQTNRASCSASLSDDCQGAISLLAKNQTGCNAQDPPKRSACFCANEDPTSVAFYCASNPPSLWNTTYSAAVAHREAACLAAGLDLPSGFLDPPADGSVCLQGPGEPDSSSVFWPNTTATTVYSPMTLE